MCGPTNKDDMVTTQADLKKYFCSKKLNEVQAQPEAQFKINR